MNTFSLSKPYIAGVFKDTKAQLTNTLVTPYNATSDVFHDSGFSITYILLYTYGYKLQFISMQYNCLPKNFFSKSH